MTPNLFLFPLLACLSVPMGAMAGSLLPVGPLPYDDTHPAPLPASL
jgi:hypothetical protein